MPVNVASIASITVESLNNVEGVEARGFFINKHKYHYPSSNSHYFEGVSRIRKPLKWAMQLLRRYFLFRSLYKWADIVHWIYDDAGLNKGEVRFIKRHKKPCVVEWVGSDIRNPERLFGINKYYKQAFNNGYEYSFYESEKQSFYNQAKFLSYGAIPLVNPEMDLYLNKDLFPFRFFIPHKLFLNEFLPVYPSPDNRKPLILHSPTAKFAKGSNFILPVIEELQKEYDFDFKLLQNMPRTEVLDLMRGCDIFIDQLIIGMYGLASSEAMAFGKPVVCYIMPEVFENGLAENCPIVNTTVETLKETLVRLICDPALRNKIGKASRKFAEENFEAKSNAKKLLTMYREVIFRTTKH